MCEVTRQLCEETRQLCEVTRQLCEEARQLCEETRQLCEVTRQLCELCEETRQLCEKTRHRAKSWSRLEEMTRDGRSFQVVGAPFLFPVFNLLLSIGWPDLLDTIGADCPLMA